LQGIVCANGGFLDRLTFYNICSMQWAQLPN